ncbi:MAG: acetate--CoA ligase family protein [Burkholderiales bacterium]
MSGSSSTDEAAQRAQLASVVFRPDAIALVGASDDPSRLTSRPQRVLRRHGYNGSIVPIHPTGDRIAGERAYRSMTAVPEAPDHAFVMLPSVAVPQAIEDCAAAGVKVATILSAGFSETGARGRRRQDAIVAVARAAGMRLIGPNCLGLINVSGNFALSANAVFEHETLRPGALSVVSQSGSMLGAIVTRAQERGLGFSKLISVGNECDLAVGELTHLLVDDGDTRAILLFLEALRDADILAAAAQRAFQADKPVIAFMLGRSAAGREAAATHTGTLAADARVAKAFFHANGILCVDVFEALFETAQLVLGHRPPTGRRVGAVTVSGGAAAMVVDRLGLSGIALVPPPARVVENLSARRIRTTDARVIDLPMGRADGGAYAAVLDQLIASDHCDLVLAVQGSNAAYSPESVRERVLAAKRGGKPLAVFVGPRAERALSLLEEQGVAAFRTPEACASAIQAYLDWHAPQPRASVPETLARVLRAAIRAAGGGWLNEYEAAKVLAAVGIPFAPACVVQSGADPVDLPFPVAAKLLSRDIAHKTDLGGVLLDIADAAALARSVDAILASARSLRPHARIDGVLVQAMQRGLGEAIVGFRRDPQVGPVVLVGAGGGMAEYCGDPAIRLAPVSLATAAAMIGEVPALAPLRGLRNRPPGDLGAFARTIHRLSLLAGDATVLEAEINPLIVAAEGVVAVDALVRLADACAGEPC